MLVYCSYTTIIQVYRQYACAQCPDRPANNTTTQRTAGPRWPPAALLANKTFDFNVGKLRTVLLNLRDRLAKKDEKLQAGAGKVAATEVSLAMASREPAAWSG